MALNAALATASRALEVFSTGVQVSANNIANANTPGFVREELAIKSANTFQRGSLIVGSGVEAASVHQVIDQYLETRIHTAGSNAAASNARQDIYSQLETQLGELGDSDLSSRLSQFTAAINEVVTSRKRTSATTPTISNGKVPSGRRCIVFPTAFSPGYTRSAIASVITITLGV